MCFTRRWAILWRLAVFGAANESSIDAHSFRCWEQLGQRVFCRVSALPKTPAGALEQTLELGVAAYMGENIVVHIQARTCKWPV